MSGGQNLQVSAGGLLGHEVHFGRFDDSPSAEVSGPDAPKGKGACAATTESGRQTMVTGTAIAHPSRIRLKSGGVAEHREML
jgi:hypothetical protein